MIAPRVSNWHEMVSPNLLNALSAPDIMNARRRTWRWHDGARNTLFIAGDDSEAKHVTSTFVRPMGFDPVDAGPLASARYLEPLAMLMVELVRGQGFGPAGITLRLTRHATIS